MVDRVYMLDGPGKGQTMEVRSAWAGVKLMFLPPATNLWEFGEDDPIEIRPEIAEYEIVGRAPTGEYLVAMKET